MGNNHKLQTSRQVLKTKANSLHSAHYDKADGRTRPGKCTQESSIGSSGYARAAAVRGPSNGGRQPEVRVAYLEDVSVESAQLALPRHQVVQLLARVLVRAGRHLQVDGALHPQQPETTERCRQSLTHLTNKRSLGQFIPHVWTWEYVGAHG